MVLSLDASRYDMHLSREIQRATDKRFFDSNVHGKRPDWGLISDIIYDRPDRLRTKNGLEANGTFGRKSGEANTSFGNSFAMFCMLAAFMRSLGVRQDQWTLFDDGDDCLLFLAPSIEPLVSQAIAGFFAQLGFDLKLENRTNVVEKVKFCQCQPVEVEAGVWNMVRHPWRVLSRGTTVLYGGKDPKIRLNHCYSVGKCELALNSGMPILQAYAEALQRCGKGGRMLARADAEYEHRFVKLNRAVHKDVALIARESFYRAFDISPPEQIQAEAQLNDWYFDPEANPTGDVRYDARFQFVMV